MKKELLYLKEEYQKETYKEVVDRYRGFGKDIYLILKEKLPTVYTNLYFYRNTKYQQEDSYAVYSNDKKSFAIQLDPICQVIVLWNNKFQIEIGTWSKNEYEEALEFIKSTLF